MGDHGGEIMTDWTLLLLSCFAATMSVCFAMAMIFSEGLADMNAYGEGWFEVLLAGGLAVMGLRKVIA